MVSKYLGEDVFLAGIAKYLKKHAYGNTKTEDLWAALAEESGKDVERIANLWTKRIGYPVLSVTESQDEITVTQNRFLSTGDVKAEEDETLFWIPLALKTIDQSGNVKVDTDASLSTRTKSIKLGSGNTYKLNSGHSGIYRVNYTPEHLSKLGGLASKTLTAADRAGLVADAGALAVSGYGKTSGLLTLVEQWKTETDFVVWSEIIGRLDSISAAWVFEDKKVLDALKAFKRQLVSEPAHAFGYQFSESDDAFVENQLKTLLFSAAAGAGDEKIVRASQDMFKKFAAGDKEAIHPNLRRAVFKTVLQNGGEKEYDTLLATFLDTDNSPDVRNSALVMLGSSRDANLIQRSLKMLESKDVKDQDIMYPIMGLSTHKEGIEAAFAFLKDNYTMIDKRVPNAVGSLKSTVVALMTQGFTSLDKVHEIEAFFKEKDTKAFDKRLLQVLDGIRGKSQWVSRDKGDVEQFLAKYA